MKNDAANMRNLVIRNGFWCSDFVDPMGRRIRKALGTKDRKLAELKLMKMQVIAYEKGNFDMKKPIRMLFRDLAPKILEYAKDRFKSYQKVYLPVMKHLVKYFGDKYLHEITASQIIAYQSERKKAVAPITVNKEVSVLGRCFNFAIENDPSLLNPVKRVKHFKVPEKEIRYLTIEEVSRLLQSCTGYIREIILTALHTGGRKTEILTLRWKNIDFENRQVAFVKTKNNKVRYVPMTEALYFMLSNRRSYAPSKEFVFTDKNGEPFGQVNKAFRSALKSASIENFTLHGCRHTYASQLVMSGVDLLTVKELLGHGDIKTTLIYAHLAPKHKVEAVKTYEKHLGQVVSLRHIYDTRADSTSAV